MLAHKPSFPFIIDVLHTYDSTREDTNPKDNEDVLLALQHRDRVRRIRMQITNPDLEPLIMAMDGVFPRLEYLVITPPTEHFTSLTLPSTFHAPHLRHLMLLDTRFPIASPSLATPAGLVTLSLRWSNISTFLLPDELLQRLSLVPRLEMLQISLDFPVFDDNVEKQMSHAPIMTDVALPNLRNFAFEGDTAYFEALLPWMTVPLLEKLNLMFFREHTFHAPHLLQLLTVAASPRFSFADLTFYDEFLSLTAYSRGSAGLSFSVLYLDKGTYHHQIDSAVQLFSSLGTLFSAVEYLTLGYNRSSGSEVQDADSDRTRWHKLLRAFPNVKSLRIEDRHTGELSRSLHLDHGEPPVDLLPQLKNLLASDKGVVDIFYPFADARQKAGCPVSLLPLWG